MINKVILLGNLTKEAEVKKLKGGKAYARFTVALNTKDKSMFINCIAFDKTAELVANYFTKGSHIGVTGSLDIQEKDGKYYTNIIVNEVSFAGYKKAEAEEAMEDLPF